MALVTSLIDYFVVGALLLFWDRICRTNDGSICPFTAAGTPLVGLAVLHAKDEIQCRGGSSSVPTKSTPGLTLGTCLSFDHIFIYASFLFLRGLGMFLSGFVRHESVKNPKVLLQVLLESLFATDAITRIVMLFFGTSGCMRRHTFFTKNITKLTNASCHLAHRPLACLI